MFTRSTRSLLSGLSLAVLLSSLALALPASAAVRRVKADAPGPAHDGTSWATAYLKVSEALSAAAPGDEVWVASGTYVENITLPSGVALYGGFAGTETARDGRDFRANVTTLDGGKVGTVITIPNTVTVEAVVDGFTIRNGFAREAGGGGIRCRGTATIRNNVITDNRASGHCTDGSCTSASGGGIDCGGTATIVGNTIINNSANYGGGIDAGGNVTIRGNLIARNRAFAYRLTGFGGGIIAGSGCQILNNTVTENQADSASGVYVPRNAAGVTIVNNVLYNNPVPYSSTPDDLRLDSTTIVHHNSFTPGQFAPPPAGNLEADPLFADPANGDYRLKLDSPCIDAGDDTAVQAGETDLDRNPRIRRAHVDIGAYEMPLVRFVKHDALGPAHDGTTWATAFQTVQAGIDAAATGDEIWVAVGTYTELVTLKSGVALYGGFAGTETARDGRDFRANVTTLDGNHAGSVVTIPATVTTAAVLDGFTIRNGLGKTLGGGGVLCQGAAEIRNNLIVNNQAYVGCSGDTGECTNLNGGGILCLAATATIAGNVILDNRAYQGGGIAVSNAANARILNNVIARNNAFGSSTRYTGAGGGIAVNNASCQILNNTVTANKGQIASGIFAELGVTNVTVANNIVFNNTEPNLAWVENLRVGTGAVVHHNCVSPDQAVPVPDGNLRADPLFLDPANGDYHLREGSPCIDAGDSSLASPGETDLGGGKRIIGPAVDIGAYEAPIYATLADAVLALKAAGGLQAVSPADFARLNIAWSIGTQVDVCDATALIRKAVGLDQ